jgi:predicted dehydrogenase
LEEYVATLRVGIAGAGGIAHQHARGWRDNAPRGQLVALADISPERAQIIADEYTGGKAKVYSTLDEMIADPDVDAIDICLPHDLHAEAIIKAAKAGKIILCEKPLCTTQADAARIGATLKETGATFMMAHNNLFQPSLLEARKLLQLNTIGKTFVIRSIECFQNSGALLGMQGKHNLAPGESPWAWRNDPKRMGGGEVLDTGWHGTYRLLALADERPVEVSAVMDRFLIPGLTSEDTGILTVTFESGKIGQMFTSWAFTVPGDTQFEVIGELGSLSGTSKSISHQLHGWPEATTRELKPVHTFTAELTNFLDVVQKGDTNLATFETGARVLQLTKAAYKAAAEKRTIALPEDPMAEA